MTVGENIKKIRKEKKISQKQLGVLCGMSEAQIGQYENGYRSPKFETVLKIANALEVSINELLDISETTKESNIQKITLNVEIKNIDEETKKAEKLIELLKEAKSLADDLASIDFEIHV